MKNKMFYVCDIPCGGCVNKKMFEANFNLA